MTTCLPGEKTGLQTWTIPVQHSFAFSACVSVLGFHPLVLHFWPLFSPNLFFHLVPPLCHSRFKTPSDGTKCKALANSSHLISLSFPLSVDYSNEFSLIFRIRQQAYLHINSNYLALISSCTKPCDVLYALMCHNAHYSILNMLEGSASVGQAD